MLCTELINSDSIAGTNILLVTNFFLKFRLEKMQIVALKQYTEHFEE